MRKLIVAYIKFWWRSKNQHGIHSPFVYDLITNCFYDKKEKTAYSKIKAYRKQLLQNKSTINVTDLGAGSQVTKETKRVISQIAKNAGTTPSRSKLFYRLVNYFQFNTILELGTSLGIATHTMSLAKSKAKITTIEGCPNISRFTRDNLKKHGVTNITVLTGDFSEVIKPLVNNTYDFIYFDGNHQKDATLNYFNTLLKTTNANSVFIFDDIYWSKGMTEAWETIIQHPKVTVSIDTFFWGLIFFRKEQAKEHFSVRL